MQAGRVVRTAGLIVLVVGAAVVLGGVVVRDQISRSRRDLFSAQPLRRLAALTYLGGHDATVEVVQLLRDFVAWEPRPLIRRRAAQVLRRMEDAMSRDPKLRPGEVAG
ncbi:MAG: hypothetical protein ACRELV_12095 [Longimicrobiales bacterium]